MRAKLVPVYFDPGRDEEFDAQLSSLRELLAEDAELLEPAALGGELPQADAVVFPQLLGEAFGRAEDFRRLEVPVLAVTSEFGTLSMWDWEILSFLRDQGLRALAPYNLDQCRTLCRALAARRGLRDARFLAFQDRPGESGFQPGIFKRFFWWTEACLAGLRERFGVTVERKSFEELAARARGLPDEEAGKVLAELDLPAEGLETRQLLSAVKLYLELEREAGADERIWGMGVNCLNESHFSDTTPCLAWDLLYRQRGIAWACEGDVVSLATMVLLQRSLGRDAIMTNIYPFLLAQAALAHERIPEFPRVEGPPEDHLLLAHCGYLGVVPRSMATEWTLRPKVLAIVDENAHAIDARAPAGPVTLAKLDSTLRCIQTVEGELVGYAQYPESHCRNGAVLRVPDGRNLMRRVCSHHQCLLAGHHRGEIEMVAEVFGLQVEVL
jgi:hypothetical protein